MKRLIPALTILLLAGFVWAGGVYTIQFGYFDGNGLSRQVFIQEPNDIYGRGRTGLIESNFFMYAKRTNDTAAVAVVWDTAASKTLGTYKPTDPNRGCIKEVSAANMPGVYEVDFPSLFFRDANTRNVTFYLNDPGAPAIPNVLATAIEFQLVPWACDPRTLFGHGEANLATLQAKQVLQDANLAAAQALKTSIAASDANVIAVIVGRVPAAEANLVAVVASRAAGIEANAVAVIASRVSGTDANVIGVVVSRVVGADANVIAVVVSRAPAIEANVVAVIASRATGVDANVIAVVVSRVSGTDANVTGVVVSRTVGVDANQWVAANMLRTAIQTLDANSYVYWLATKNAIAGTDANVTGYIVSRVVGADANVIGVVVSRAAGNDANARTNSHWLDANLRDIGAVAGTGGGGGGATLANLVQAEANIIAGTHWLDANLRGIAANVSSIAIAAPTGTKVLEANILVSGLPLAGAKVEVSTDAAKANVVRIGFADAFGYVSFLVDPGTYYLWVTKSGYSFTNPTTKVVP